MLSDHAWQLKYTPEYGDLVKLFYIPALEDAERYDRLTGYFNAGALALAARGIEGLVRNGGRMRLVVGCTLGPPEIEAIETGEALREQIEKHLTTLPLAPPDAGAADALELLAWMVARGHLDVKVAVPCGPEGKPVHDSAIFHEKTGIVEDRAGNRIAWTGSLNETAAGWRRNWESISVYTSWGPEPERVDGEERSFTRLWANRSTRVMVLDVPEAARRDLMRFMPDHVPARLGASGAGQADRAEGASTRLDSTPEPSPPPPAAPPAIDRRTMVWTFIRDAPRLAQGGARVGDATAAVTPWSHQVRAFERLYGRWPPKLLIADEVGLGKTIQAGMLLRQTWLSGRAKRILILAPKAVLGQWQIELREKFNLNWPIYDGRKFVRYPSPALRGNHEREVNRDEWCREPVVIASSQLMRRQDRALALLEQAEPWDLVVLDEAHHARRRAAGARKEGGPNALLALMRQLRAHTQGLVLLTATPMQVHPVEVWDLLDLLGLPPEWTADAFLKFFEDIDHPNPSPEALERMAQLFRAVERDYGGLHGRRPTPDRAVPVEDGQGAARATRCSQYSAPADGDTGASCGSGGSPRAHADPAPGLEAHPRIAAPVLQGGDAVDPDRGAPGRGPFHRHDAGGACALQRRRGVHRPHLRQGVRPRALGGGIRDDDLPPPSREQLRRVTQHVRKSSPRHGRPGAGVIDRA